MNELYRMFTGQTETRWGLIAGAMFVLIWFLIDLHQYIGWLLEDACQR